MDTDEFTICGTSVIGLSAVSCESVGSGVGGPNGMNGGGAAKGWTDDEMIDDGKAGAADGIGTMCVGAY